MPWAGVKRVDLCARYQYISLQLNHLRTYSDEMAFPPFFQCVEYTTLGTRLNKSNVVLRVHERSCYSCMFALHTVAVWQCTAQHALPLLHS